MMLPQKSATLSGALSEVVSSAQVVQELPLANCTMDSRFVYFIVNNFDTIHSALQQSLNLRSRGYQKRFSEYSPLVCATMLGPSGMCALDFRLSSRLQLKMG
jgi:hypothetical protein